MVLMVVLMRTWAVPVFRLLRVLMMLRVCPMSQFRSLFSQELQTFKRAKVIGIEE